MGSQPASQPANVQSQQGRPEEQRVKVQPDIPVKAGTQVKVPLPGTGKLHYAGLHPVIVAGLCGFRNRLCAVGSSFAPTRSSPTGPAPTNVHR